MKNGIGEPVRRKEDLRLVTGRGEFSDDLNLPRQAHAAILRAPHGHARILRIDTTAAKAAPGVLAVLIGSDYVAEGLKPIPNNPLPPDLPLAIGSEPLLRQALDCLLDNALRHGAGAVTMAARPSDDAVTIAISDQGGGFAPAFAVRSDAGGHGMGLSLARRLVEASSGRLVIADPGPEPVVQIVLLRTPAPG